MDEQQLLAALAQADRNYEDAKYKMAQAKRLWIDAESMVLETKLAYERLQERLRVYRKTTPGSFLESREADIEGYRERNPEVVEFARQRDETQKEE